MPPEAVGASAVPAPRPPSEIFGEAELEEVRGRLLRAVRRRCPPWLAEQSEDLVQEALVRVMEALRSRPTAEPVRMGYLVKATYSRLIDEIRRRRVRREVPLEESGTPDGFATPRPTPERATAGRQIGRAVRDCLAGLAVPRRRAVTLYLRGHSARQTASLLGWNRRRAENLVFRGLRDLRQCLCAKGVER